MNLNVPLPAALAALVLAAPLTHAADPIREALQRGLLAEEAQHDLAAAADAYAEAVRLGDEERSFVATALFRLAEAQRRLGRTNEAAIGYRRLLRDFGEMTNLTAIALSRDSAPAPVSAGSFQLQLEREKVLAELQSLTNRISELEALRTRVIKTTEPDASGVLAAANPTPELNRLRTECNQSEARLAALRNEFGPQHPERAREEVVLKTLQHQLQQEIQGILQSLDLRAASLQREREQQERRVRSLALLKAQEEIVTPGLESTQEDGRRTAGDYLRQEIAIAEQQVKRLEEFNKRGAAEMDAVLTARREVLALKRQLASLPARDLLVEPATYPSASGLLDVSAPAPNTSSTNSVVVLGPVTRPGIIPIPDDGTLDLVESIARSGGLTKSANRNRILVYRDGKTLEISLDQAIAKRFELQPGDRVEVRERVF